MTVIPIFATYGEGCVNIHDVANMRDVVYYALCGMSTTRILRILRVRKRILKIEDEVDRFLGNICLYIVVMLLFSKCMTRL